MEQSAASIMQRVAGRSGPMAGREADAKGRPIPGTSTMRTDSKVDPNETGDLAGHGNVDSSSGGSSSSSSGSTSTVGSFMNKVGDAISRVTPSGIVNALNTTTAASVPYTDQFGHPIDDATHSYQIGGFPLASDRYLFEKQQSFNRAKVVERAVHACGSGAFGYFEVTKEVSHLTKAKFLSSVGKQTPVFARFSTVTYGREFPDEARNPRGLAFKFYTEDGNYDILSINFPTFFTRDGAMGADNIRSQQRSPQSFQVNFDSIFDWMSLVPESTLTNMWFWSDHGTPNGWRNMDAYPCHTFKWVNAAGEFTYIRYIFKAETGVKNFNQAQATLMCGQDPDYSKRDMYKHIEQGGTCTWICHVQTMTQAQALDQALRFDPFDVTKMWPEEQFPPMEFGRIVMDRNPENYHRDVEQAAFSPGDLVPGVEPSPDPLLQFRMFLYRDAQMYRIGVNMAQIPVNCPFMAKHVHPFERDGAMRVNNNGGVEPHYYPNSASNPPPPRSNASLCATPHPVAAHPGMTTSAMLTAFRGSVNRHESGDLGPDTEYEQATGFYVNTLDDEGRANLAANIAQGLSAVTRADIKVRSLVMCYKVSPQLARNICSLLADKGIKDVDWGIVERNAKHFNGKLLVDRKNGYAPLSLVD